MNSFRAMLYDMTEKRAQTAEQIATLGMTGGPLTSGEARGAINAMVTPGARPVPSRGFKSLVLQDGNVGVGQLMSAATNRALRRTTGKISTASLVESLYAKKAEDFDPSVSRMVGSAIPSMPLPEADVPVPKIPSLPPRTSLTAKTAPDPDELAEVEDLEVEAMFRAMLRKQAAERELEEKGFLTPRAFRNANPMSKTASLRRMWKDMVKGAQVVGPYAGGGSGIITAGERALRENIARSFQGYFPRATTQAARTAPRVARGGMGFLEMLAGKAPWLAKKLFRR